MKTCPWCEGRKVTMRFAYGEGQTVNVLGRQVPLATALDQSCGICEGTGEVSDARHAELTIPRDSEECRRIMGDEK